MRASRRSTAARAAPLLLGLVLASASACSSSHPNPDSGPRLDEVDCPQDVEILVVPPHTCAYVVTSGRSGAELRIFTVAIEPPVPSDLAPVLETGTDLGMTPTYGGLAPIAQRTGRRLVLVDLPGTGHSTPSLDCPEMEGLPVQPEDGAVESAVATCRSRLEDDGVVPDDVAPAELGDVLHDVTIAYDVPRWVVMGHGTSGVAALDLAGEHPETVEALVLDSVIASDPDPDQTLTEVVADIAAQCRDDARCLPAYGDPARTWTDALDTLSSSPITVSVDGQDLVLDETALPRVTRWLVGWNVLGPQLLPELLTEAASGEAGRLLSLYAGTLTAAPPLCVGYLPKCVSSDRVATGAVLTTLCPALASSDDWAAPCRAWGVGPDLSSVAPVDDVPTLALHGHFDPFSPPEQVRADLARLVPDAFVVEIATLTHNVLAHECVRTIRNEWLAGPLDAPSTNPSCLTEQLTFD